jgi:hypothetical protein
VSKEGDRLKPIRVIDKNFNLLAEIDDYEALIFTRSYHKYGQFELHININKKDTDKLQKDNLIIIGSDTKKVGIIRHRELKLDESGKQSETLLVKGFELKSVLGRRFTVPPAGQAYDYINNNAETVLKHYVDVNVINPTNVNRRIKNLIIADNLNRGEQIKYQSRFKQLDSELEKISIVSGLGWTVYLDIQNKKWVFDVLEGKDLTSSQTNNPPVIFSVDFDNIKGQHFIDSELNYKNVAYVGGQGQGESREIVEINSEKSGLDRIETFIDARDIDIQEDLVDRGLQKLKELEPLQSFTSEVSTYGPFKYQEDWDIGDIVAVQNKKWNITLDSRITEVKEIYEPDRFSIEVTFGSNIPTIIDKIKQELDKPLIETGGEIGEVSWSSIPDKPSEFTPAQHDHNDLYYTEDEINNLLNSYALSSHNHDTIYSAITHDHDGRYYTESEINGLLSNKSDVGHTHSYLPLIGGTIDGLTVIKNDSGIDVTNTGQIKALQIYQPTAGADALMTFHVAGDHACHFGLAGDINDLVVGGWSKGANRYRIWHEGNFDPLTKADVGHTHSYAPLSPSYHYVKAGNEETKFRLWGTSNYYGVGMVSGVTYGYLGDYAMTFCMNNDSDRGWWWGYQGQSKSDGAMSLTTDGRLKLKDRLSFGGHSGDDRYIRGEGEYLRIQTPYGFINIGAGNTSYSHFFTDRPSFYFNRAVAVNGDIKYYNYNNSEYLANVSKNVTHDVLHNNTTLKSGFYTTAEGLYNANNTAQIEGNWWHIINMHHHNNDGFNAQIAVGLSGGKERIYTRWSSGGAWTEWDKVPVGNCGKITISSSAPISPQINDIWIDTSS